MILRVLHICILALVGRVIFGSRQALHHRSLTYRSSSHGMSPYNANCWIVKLVSLVKPSIALPLVNGSFVDA
jgi:hypothetical protein